MYRGSRLRSTLNTSYIIGLGMWKVCTEAVDCVALWTRVTLGLGMCKVCTEAVDCVALWTRVTLGLGMCKVCTEAVDCVALWTRVTLGLGMWKVCTEAVDCVALWTRVTLGLGMCKVCTEAVHSFFCKTHFAKCAEAWDGFAFFLLQRLKTLQIAVKNATFTKYCGHQYKMHVAAQNHVNSGVLSTFRTRRNPTSEPTTPFNILVFGGWHWGVIIMDVGYYTLPSTIRDHDLHQFEWETAFRL